MVDGSQELIAFLGVAADRRLLNEDLFNLPEAEQRREPAVATDTRTTGLSRRGRSSPGVDLDRRCRARAVWRWRLLFHWVACSTPSSCRARVLLVATHWGWVHVAEYVGLTIDQRQQARDRPAQAGVACRHPAVPALQRHHERAADASTRIERVLHRPVLTDRGTFTFVRETVAEQTYDASTSAADIATAVETMRRDAAPRDRPPS